MPAPVLHGHRQPPSFVRWLRERGSRRALIGGVLLLGLSTVGCHSYHGRMAPTRSSPAVEPPPPTAAEPMREVLGFSVEHRPIEAVIFPNPGPRVLILGGTHGDEPKSVYVAQRLIGRLSDDPARVAGCHVVIVPVVNPDGDERRTRRNAHGVDVNRNFPTENWAASAPRSRFYGGPAPASEPETRVLMDLVNRLAPQRILTLHSISQGRFCNNFDGPGAALAAMLSEANRYPVQPSIGYPTPGSFGTWAGVEQGIPTITLELPSHVSRERCWLDNRPALLAFIRGTPTAADTP